MLDAIPVGSRFRYADPVPLRVWRTAGYYTVTDATKNQFSLLTANVEIGSALLSDAEHLLDHAAEHQVLIYRTINMKDWSSPAWLVVTFYYWSFFLALSLTRLLGQTVWYLDQEAVEGFSIAAPNPPVKKVGAGTFGLACGSKLNSTEREVILCKSKESRLHEHLWKLFFKICKAKLSKFQAGTFDGLEERLFACFERSATQLGSHWPSDLRNVVNYRPGFAYDTIRRTRVLGNFDYLKGDKRVSVENLIDRLENNIALTRSASSVIQNPKIVSRMLVDFTFLLHAFVSELHEDLLNRNSLDNRWKHNRGRFLRGEGLYCDSGLWPCY
ncbi:hypothetical protein V5E97_25455 [Singulisphaera sp. Ch08]|uniref:Uncharacterized protein n=1 Tax=Singulisphaera sp. Ch08 TaxID=3120278 RepID=A0AAU7C991_9BACT